MSEFMEKHSVARPDRGTSGFMSAMKRVVPDGTVRRKALFVILAGRGLRRPIRNVFQRAVAGCWRLGGLTDKPGAHVDFFRNTES